MLNKPATALRFNRLLLTGAAGHLGQILRPRLKAYCQTLRLSDHAAMAPAGPGEEVIGAPLEDAQAVFDLLQDVDAVVHLGGVSTEQPWAPILSANIMGMINLYEAARRHQVKRIVYASSNHVTGFYRQGESIDTRVAPRPDGFYGLSKAFGEDVAQMYWDRWGIETASLRIGSSYEAPKDRRMLATWLSFDDLERLVMASLSAAQIGHTIVYGMSNNQGAWWDNRHARHLGFVPQDSSDVFRAETEARQPHIDASDPAAIFQGGAFVKMAPHDH